MQTDKSGARPSGTGSHASHRAAVGVDGPSGFDPARVKYVRDLQRAVSEQSNRAAQAERRVRDLTAENTRLRHSSLTRQDIEDTCHDIFIVSSALKDIPGSALQFVASDIADQLAPRLAIATEAGTATTPQSGVVHEGAGLKGIAQKEDPNAD